MVIINSIVLPTPMARTETSYFLLPLGALLPSLDGSQLIICCSTNLLGFLRAELPLVFIISFLQAEAALLFSFSVRFKDLI